MWQTGDKLLAENDKKKIKEKKHNKTKWQKPVNIVVAKEMEIIRLGWGRKKNEGWRKKKKRKIHEC